MLKRMFDLVAALMGLLILSPILIVLSIIIKITSPGPILYKAARVGRNGDDFRVFKFRSMVADAHKMGPGITTAGDARITPIGRFLRKTKLDELPQLFNVLRGDMSVVGPRPEDPRYVALYTDEQRQVLNVRPGITSPASVKYRNEESLLTGDDWETHYINEIMPNKLAIDMEYAQKPSLRRDIGIILSTVKALFVSE